MMSSQHPHPAPIFLPGINYPRYRSRRPPWFLSLGFVVLTLMLLYIIKSVKSAAKVELHCAQNAYSAQAFFDHSAASLPNTHYFFNKRYGWFDRSHFNTGSPGQVIADVRAAAANGGGMITIHQGVQDDITGFTAVYYISERVPEAQILATALGVYMDWSLRFESWQAHPPQGILGPLTPFAIEDLPSQYLGFFAQAHKMPIDAVFACYLGDVSASEEGPPDIILSGYPIENEGQLEIVHLQNKSFSPMIETSAGWRHVNWPQEMLMTPATSHPNTWQFVSDTTWYLDEQVLELHLTRPTQYTQSLEKAQ